MNVRQKIRLFDTRLTAKLSSYKFDPKSALIVGRLTSPVFWATYLLLTHVFWLSPGVLVGDVLLVMAFLPLASLLKLFIRRKRPATLYVNNMKVKSYSFPSSHAYSASLACGYFGFLAAINGAIIFAPFILAVAGIVGISRIIVGAHYPSDVVAGWLLGLFVLSCITVY